jgi:protein-tyrosine phosphatase
MHVIFGGDPDGKIIKFMTFAGEDRDVADPWFTGNFDVTYRDVVSGCNKIVEYIKKNQK